MTKEFEIDPELVEKVSRNPGLVRATLVATAALLGSIVGREFAADWIDPLMNLYTIAVVPLMGWWVQRRVIDPPQTGKHAKQ